MLQDVWFSKLMDETTYGRILSSNPCPKTFLPPSVRRKGENLDLVKGYSWTTKVGYWCRLPKVNPDLKMRETHVV